MISMLCSQPVAALTSEQGNVIDELLYGMAAEILEWKKDDRVKVRTEYCYEGYLKQKYLTSPPPEWNPDKKITVVAPFVDILEMPRVQARRILTVPRGALLSLAGKTMPGGWQEIQLLDGRKGFAAFRALRRIPPQPMEISEEVMRKSLTDTSRSYLRAPYRWGGKTPMGIDCSGLCSLVYFLHGVIIYRDAVLKEGFPVKQIPLWQRQPGDLLYFPGHIAMVLEGERYIHATAKPEIMGVTINSLSRLDADYRGDLAGSVLAVGSIFE